MLDSSSFDIIFSERTNYIVIIDLGLEGIQMNSVPDIMRNVCSNPACITCRATTRFAQATAIENSVWNVLSSAYEYANILMQNYFSFVRDVLPDSDQHRSDELPCEVSN